VNLVDSSGWLEYFSDGPNASVFAKALVNPSRVLVPSTIVFEVFKRVLQQRDETAAFETVTFMLQGQQVDLDASLAMTAAKVSADLGLPLADSIILTIAQEYGALLWTQDADFSHIEGVRYIPKKI
jgi:toxin FitB